MSASVCVGVGVWVQKVGDGYRALGASVLARVCLIQACTVTGSHDRKVAAEHMLDLDNYVVFSYGMCVVRYTHMSILLASYPNKH